MGPVRLAELNAQAHALAKKYLPNEPGNNGRYLDKASNALQAAKDLLPDGEYTWFTVQLADGNISSQHARSAERSVLSQAFWWHLDVVWIVEDPDFVIRDRYYDPVPKGGGVPDKNRDKARWAVTDGPVDDPWPINIPSYLKKVDDLSSEQVMLF